MHLVTLTFDDGFRKSCCRVAEIFEQHHLTASFNVIATGHRPDFVPPDQWQAAAPMGDFALWNELQSRGHEITPHGLRHVAKGTLPLAEGQSLILNCLDVFTRELKNFNPREAIFSPPYNSLTPALEAWLPTVVKAYRINGTGINPLPHPGQVSFHSTAHGPKNCEAHLDQHIEKLLSEPSGWLVYILHGLDEEGWGPIRADYLDRLLTRLQTIPSVRMLPAGNALALANKSK